MLFRMLRTQTSEHGTFRMGVAYDAGKDAGHIKTANAFIKAALAEEVTAKQLDKEKTEAEKLASTRVKSKKSDSNVMAIKEAQAAAAAAQQEVDAAKAAEAVAVQEAEAAKAEASAMAARIAELEVLVKAKDGEQGAK